MNEEARKPYTDLAVEDKKRFDSQMKSLSTKGFFLLPNGQKSSAMHKVEKDDLKVKITKSAYVFFLKDNLAKTKHEG